MTINRNLSILASGVSSTGVLGVPNGGSGATTLTGYLIGNGTGAFTASATIPTSALSGTVSLTTQVSGILPIANGGTGLTSLTAGYIPYGNGTSAFSSSSTLTYNGTSLSAGNFIPSSFTVPTNGLFLPAANTLGFSTASTEAMRIDSSGNLLVGTTSAIGNGQFVVKPAGAKNGYTYYAGADNQNGATFFNASATQVGSIYCTNSLTAYITTSDYRLKENVEPMIGALNKVLQLKPVTYNWKVDGTPSQGFIAHELQEVYPEAVFGEKDAVNKDGSIKAQGIDTSFLVATLVSAIQQLNDKVTALETQLGK